MKIEKPKEDSLKKQYAKIKKDIYVQAYKYGYQINIIVCKTLNPKIALMLTNDGFDVTVLKRTIKKEIYNNSILLISCKNAENMKKGDIKYISRKQLCDILEKLDFFSSSTICGNLIYIESTFNESINNTEFFNLQAYKIKYATWKHPVRPIILKVPQIFILQKIKQYKNYIKFYINSI